MLCKQNKIELCVSILVQSGYEYACVLFTVLSGSMVLLHGFIKKSQATPADDLETAKARIKQVRGA